MIPAVVECIGEPLPEPILADTVMDKDQILYCGSCLGR